VFENIIHNGMWIYFKQSLIFNNPFCYWLKKLEIFGIVISYIYCLPYTKFRWKNKIFLVNFKYRILNWIEYCNQYSYFYHLLISYENICQMFLEKNCNNHFKNYIWVLNSKIIIKNLGINLMFSFWKFWR
jgi:hypothetical protein